MINIAPLMAARRAASAPVPWTVLFLKAHALAARDIPSLRRNFVSLPWPHFYDTETSVGFIMMQRAFDGEVGVFVLRIKEPEERALTDMGQRLRHAMEAPLDQLPHLRFVMRIARLPGLIRRPLWWLAFNIGALRMRYFASLAVSAVGRDSAHVNQLVSPLTSMLTYGPFAENGDVEIMLTIDHRSVDGVAMGEALIALERKLNGPVRDELLGLSQ